MMLRARRYISAFFRASFHVWPCVWKWSAYVFIETYIHIDRNRKDMFTFIHIYTQRNIHTQTNTHTSDCMRPGRWMQLRTFHISGKTKPVVRMLVVGLKAAFWLQNGNIWLAYFPFACISRTIHPVIETHANVASYTRLPVRCVSFDL